MKYLDRIKVLAERAPELATHLETEEATKNALIMPFIAALGYDVFDPREVIPEFTADVGVKKGEKVDYAIRVDDQIVMLWEAKRASETLDIKHVGQLFRYFTVTKARIGVLTNGLVYQFFSDIEEPNIMDEKPFLVIDLRDARENALRELEGMTKEAFDLESMLAAASDLKYMREVRRFMEAQLEEASEGFIKLCFSEANPQGRFSKSGREQFGRIATRVLQQMISDRVSDRLRKALNQTEVPLASTDSVSAVQAAPEASIEPDESVDEAPEDGVITTEEEIAGYLIVKAIACSRVDSARVVMRDTKSYCGILLDDNNRKPICRLHFNRAKKYIGLFDADKNEERVHIEKPADIYALADRIRETVSFYVSTED